MHYHQNLLLATVLIMIHAGGLNTEFPLACHVWKIQHLGGILQHKAKALCYISLVLYFPYITHGGALFYSCVD